MALQDIRIQILWSNASVNSSSAHPPSPRANPRALAFL